MIIATKITKKLLPILIYLLPVTFILGNLIINVFILLIAVIGLFYFDKDLSKFNDKKIFYLFSLFFFSILFSTTIELLINGYYSDWIKSLLYLRFFLLLLVIKALVSNNLINLNYFLCACFFVSGFVSIDILGQFLFGKNILGFAPISVSGKVKYFSGIFHEELIAGGYILMFSILGIFSIPFLLKGFKKISLSAVFSTVIIISFFSLLLAGNRMPTLMFILALILFSLLINKKNTSTICFLPA